MVSVVRVAFGRKVVSTYPPTHLPFQLVMPAAIASFRFRLPDIIAPSHRHQGNEMSDLSGSSLVGRALYVCLAQTIPLQSCPKGNFRICRGNGDPSRPCHIKATMGISAR